MGKVFFTPINTYKKMTETENKDTTITEEKEIVETKNETTENTEASAQHKASRGEKKLKKSLVKMGLKEVKGINRVTLKTSKNFVLYIEDPDILKSGDNAYVIFGEGKMFDYGQNFAADKANAFTKPEEANPTEEVKPEVKVEEEAGAEGDEDAGDIPEESINTLMEYANCSRAKAIKGLKKTNGDVVEAITLVSQLRQVSTW